MALTNLETFATGRVVKILVPKIVEDIAIQQLGQELSDYIRHDTPNSGPSADCCINFSEVEFLGAAALGRLMTLDRKLTANGQSPLAFANVCPAIYEVLDITKLTKRFQVYRTVAEYLSRLNQGRQESYIPQQPRTEQRESPLADSLDSAML